MLFGARVVLRLIPRLFCMALLFVVYSDRAFSFAGDHMVVFFFIPTTSEDRLDTSNSHCQ